MRNLFDVWRPERANAWREIATLQRQMERLFDDVSRREANAEFVKDVDFVPACDIEEAESHYLISLDIPGMKKEQLSVEIEGNTLTISGEKREEKEGAKGSRRAYERFHGRFERSFTLPDLAASDKVEADYKDGVLRISIPKSEQAKTKTRKIEIGDSGNLLFGKSPKKVA